jgi:hypothetical protein
MTLDNLPAEGIDTSTVKALEGHSSTREAVEAHA